MPHVKFAGEIDLNRVWQAPPAFRFSVPEEDLHLKFLESYINGARTVVLLRFILVEGRLNQTVGLLLAKAEDEWVLKLDGSTAVLRTAGVKLLIASVAGWLEGLGLTKASSTVEAYETRGRFYAAHAVTENGGS